MIKKIGQWKFNTRSLELSFQDDYFVDLEQMTDSAKILDWIFQVRSKSWATSEVLTGFIDALQTLLHPQESFCSFGSNKIIKSVRDIIEFNIAKNKAINSFIKEIKSESEAMNL